MATYSIHRLIMGKEEIYNIFCLIGDIWNFFTEMFIEILAYMLRTLASTKVVFFIPVG